MYQCKVCNVEIKRNSQSYCSSSCQQEFKLIEYIERWKQGLETGKMKGQRLSKHVRRYLFRKYNHQCSECGWSRVNPLTGKSPLEVDHIDGDCLNCTEDNLKLLCPNCHSLTPTWKALGKGNRERHMYSGLIAPLAQ